MINLVEERMKEIFKKIGIAIVFILVISELLAIINLNSTNKKLQLTNEELIQEQKVSIQDSKDEADRLAKQKESIKITIQKNFGEISEVFKKYKSIDIMQRKISDEDLNKLLNAVNSISSISKEEIEKPKYSSSDDYNDILLLQDKCSRVTDEMMYGLKENDSHALSNATQEIKDINEILKK